MEIIVVLIVAALTIVPMLTLLPHFGVNRAWAFAAILPIGTLALLWVMAMKLKELENK